MKHLFVLLSAIALISVSCSNGNTVYGFKATSGSGEEVDFSSYKGKVLLIVNTASKCGFTPQYDDLEALNKKYSGRGLAVIGFPCDQFGHQEPGTNEEIEEFCRLNYGVTFPLMEKGNVNGENAHPVFKWLYAEKPFSGFGEGETAAMMDRMLSSRDPDYALNPDIKWNFTKFVLDRKGRVVARFEPTDDMGKVEECIESLL